MHRKLLPRKWYKQLHTKLLFLGRTGKRNWDYIWCAGHIIDECFISSICSFIRDILSSIQENVSWLQEKMIILGHMFSFPVDVTHTFHISNAHPPYITDQPFQFTSFFFLPWIEYINTWMAGFLKCITCFKWLYVYEGVSLIHGMNTESANLLQDKRRYGICWNDLFVMYDSGEVDDFCYFLIDCTEFR